MFERFTESARQVVVLAQEEARKLRHGYIGTEHLLLGLLREDGRAARTLHSHGVTLESAREWFVEQVGRGDEDSPAGQLPLTPRLKKIFLMAEEDAERLGRRAIGTQHLLIALLHEGQGAGVHAIRDLGAPPEEVWVSAFRQLGIEAPEYMKTGLPPRAARDDRSWRDRLAEAGERLRRMPVEVAYGVACAFALGFFLGWLIWG
jgi:ATP-dependent Clp protease ATP-binding subunit ClpC